MIITGYSAAIQALIQEGTTSLNNAASRLAVAQESKFLSIIDRDAESGIKKAITVYRVLIDNCGDCCLLSSEDKEVYREFQMAWSNFLDKVRDVGFPLETVRDVRQSLSKLDGLIIRYMCGEKVSGLESANDIMLASLDVLVTRGVETKLAPKIKDRTTLATDTEHVKRCNWIFMSLEEWRKQLKSLLEDTRVKPPVLGPPTEEWITDYINNFIIKDGNVLTKKEVRYTLQQALGATINDIRRIYMDWKEKAVLEINEPHVNSESESNIEGGAGTDGEIDLAGGGHNWAGIQDEEAEICLAVRLRMGKPKSMWLKKATKSYNKVKASLQKKHYRFDYRIFTYWVGLRMESFVKIPKAMNFKALMGSVRDVETLLESLERFRK